MLLHCGLLSVQHYVLKNNVHMLIKTTSLLKNVSSDNAGLPQTFNL